MILKKKGHMFNRYLIAITLVLAYSFAAAELAPVPAHVDTEISPAPPSGPVLKLDYAGQPENDMRIADFLYFVALISPEPVTVSESPTNTLMVRVSDIRQKSGEDRFSINLEFEVSGQGFRHYAVDQSEKLRCQSHQLAAGKILKKQLDYIRYEGPSKGRLEVVGQIEEEVKTVTAVRLHFNEGAAASPVTIGLKDVRMVDGVVKFENELVACINILEFTREGATPHIGSVKRKKAGNNLFQRLKGRVIGVVANMLTDPINIQQIGKDTMLNFGTAVLNRDATFTFPVAENLKSN
ncbi:MAG: hypothetical protein PF904_05065 [Kiritimatiellae bacterium]|jgi:hypothetical protein|nr:hypothetical protein [Kiritimatiellia bacterium]